MQAAGGRVMIVGSMNPYIVRMVTPYASRICVYVCICMLYTMYVGCGTEMEGIEYLHSRGDGIQESIQVCISAAIYVRSMYVYMHI